ncbi:GNAT family N-acetyltransferase [Nocardioides terrisoli]|uniref:GNAT family N-acetyltransferase n=1 Tax=Nocardioides terrisoli TaxID=3388267 RepID=UPI00287B5FE8|nr:GNAT family N-acetyltransferase [Nocardioides marmorisolisilvae]
MFVYDLGGGAALGPLEPWHAEQFLAAVDGDRTHIKQLAFAYHVRTVDESRTFLQRFADAHASDARHLAGLWHGDRLIGIVGFPEFSVAMRRCEIGVWICADFEGRGLIKRAAWHALDWAFRERGMARVQWTNLLDNERSRAVAKRLGFTLEGVLRKNFVPVPGGPSHDAEVWSITADDWRALNHV